MRHPRYCLAHHPAISSNITNSTRYSVPPKLAHYPPHPRWHITHATHANTLSMPPAPGRHPRNYATHANSPPMLACQPCHPNYQEKHTISQTLQYCIPNSDRKFSKFSNLPPDYNVREEIFPYTY